MFWSFIGWFVNLVEGDVPKKEREAVVESIVQSSDLPPASYESAIIGPPPVMPPQLVKELPIPKKLSFKLYDSFGSTCYDGDNYEEGLRKAKLLPYTAYMKAFDETGEFVGVVWASPETGIAAIDINALIPN
jgi:hypothetical protein